MYELMFDFADIDVLTILHESIENESLAMRITIDTVYCHLLDVDIVIMLMDGIYLQMSLENLY